MADLGEVPCVEHALLPGDRLVFYTDGITERQTAGGAMYDEDRLRSVLGDACALSPAAIAKRVIADVEAFADGEEPADDQTLVVVGIA